MSADVLGAGAIFALHRLDLRGRGSRTRRRLPRFGKAPASAAPASTASRTIADQLDLNDTRRPPRCRSDGSAPVSSPAAAPAAIPTGSLDSSRAALEVFGGRVRQTCQATAAAAAADDQILPVPGRRKPVSNRLSVIRVDPIACDGHGLCAELFPDASHLDDWGYPVIASEPVPPTLEPQARRSCSRMPDLRPPPSVGKATNEPTLTDAIEPKRPSRARRPQLRDGNERLTARWWESF